MKDRRSERVLARRMRRGGLALAVTLATFASTRGTQDAIANGDTRSLSLYHTHTHESATITFRRNGQYDSDGLKQLNQFLRDWRNDDQTRMDPRLFDVVWAAYRESGSSEPINIVSAYRSPDTNAMLRRRSKAVAENSQHIAGKAMDFFLTDIGMDKVRAIGMRLQQGGVGFYPTSYNPFVHLDVGSVRSWPRMTQDQLARIFPDGKTVHLPTNGKPLAGYEIARAEILARGGTVAGVSSYAEGEDGNGGRRRSLWATLFGGADEDAEFARTDASAGRTRVAARSAASSDDGGTRGVAAAPTAESASPWSKLFTGSSSAETPQASEPDRSSALAFAPVPPARPELPTPLGDLPLPPQRPLALAALDPGPLGGTASVDLGYAERSSAIPHGLPPVRPGVQPPAHARLAAEWSDERGAVRVLFAAVAVEKAPRRGAPVVSARAVPAKLGSEVVAGHAPARVRMMFSQNLGGIDANRFSGPAVQPLPILR